jgi:hypothetical protein
MNISKRGGEDLTMQTIVTLIFVGMLFAILIFFSVNNATGELAKKQILAKQLCLITLDAKPGTTINVTYPGIIEKKDIGFMIKKNSVDIGYYYACYNKSVSIEKIDGNIIIGVQ